MSNSLLYYIVHCQASALWKNSEWEGGGIYGSLVSVFQGEKLISTYFVYRWQELTPLYHHVIEVKLRKQMLTISNI